MNLEGHRIVWVDLETGGVEKDKHQIIDQNSAWIIGKKFFFQIGPDWLQKKLILIQRLFRERRKYGDLFLQQL